MKRTHLYAAFTLGAAFAIAIGVGSLVASTKIVKEAEAILRDTAPANPDHYIAYFMDGTLNKTNGADDSTFSSFVMAGTDLTTNVSVKFSSAKQEKRNDEYKKCLTFGRYEETAGYPKAIAASIYNSEDEDFSSMYDGIKWKYSSSTFKFISAFFTQQYIDDIRDISVFFTDMDAGCVALVYQLEGSIEWNLLARDDGESGSPYYTYSVNGTAGDGSGTAGDWNHQVVFSYSHDNSKEPRNSGNSTSTFCEFANNLRGRSARIGVIYFNNNAGTSNYIHLNGIMINRARSIKAVVDAIEAGTITSSTSGYETLLRMGQWKIHKQQVRSLLEAHNDSDYYDAYDTLYFAETSEHFYSSKPTKRSLKNQVLDKLTRSFAYDRNVHAPDLNLMLFDDGTDTYFAKINATNYSSDVSGYSSINAPKDPFYYAVTFVLDEPYAYSYNGAMYIVFHIDEAADGSDFKADWQAKRSAGLDGMCSMLDDQSTRAELSILIKRFDQFSNETQAAVGAETDVAPYTYSESIEYFRGVLNGTIPTSNHSFAHVNTFSIFDTKSTILIFGVVFGIVSIAGVCLFIKKRKQNI